MLHNRFFIFFASLMGALLLGLTSCQYKPLCYGKVQEVEIIFDWSKLPKGVKKTMNVYFYPVGGGKPSFYQLGANGGRVRLLVGAYNILAINADSETNRFYHEDEINTFYITTRRSSQLEPMGRSQNIEKANPTGQPVYLAPDELYVARSEMEVVKTEQVVQKVLTPEDKLCQYSVEVRKVIGLKNFSTMSATISSVSPGYNPFRDKLSPTLSLIPFLIEKKGEQLYGETPTFGTDLLQKPEHTLVFYMLLQDGRTELKAFPVTEQINNAPNPKKVHIVIDSLRIPAPMIDPNSTGINVGVAGWGEAEEVNISM